MIFKALSFLQLIHSLSLCEVLNKATTKKIKKNNAKPILLRSYQKKVRHTFANYYREFRSAVA